MPVESLSPTPSQGGGSKHRACKPKFPLSGDFFSILLGFFFFAQHERLNSVMLLLGISKVSFLTLLSFYSPCPALRVPWLSPLAAPHLQLHPGDPKDRQKVLQVPPCPRARLEGAGNGVPGKSLCDGDGEGQELGAAGKTRCARVEGLGVHFVLPSVCPMAQRWSSGGFPTWECSQRKRSMIELS